MLLMIMQTESVRAGYNVETSSRTTWRKVQTPLIEHGKHYADRVLYESFIFCFVQLIYMLHPHIDQCHSPGTDPHGRGWHMNSMEIKQELA